MIKAILFDANGILYERDKRSPANEIRLANGLVDLLASLRIRCIKLAVVTNSMHSAETKLGWLEKSGLSIVWDAFISSVDVGIAKPDPAIFILALSACSVPASSAIFVGHEAIELLGASQAGLRSVGIGEGLSSSSDYIIDDLTELESLIHQLDSESVSQFK
jgi:FMN phosphatase YigB (HAD superfamily)